MEFQETAIKGVWTLTPEVFADGRGYFFESFRQDAFEKHIGAVRFVQDNESQSSYGVLRGLHYQLPPFAQSKLVRVIRGAVLDVAVDIRPGSPTFGKYVGVELSADNKRQLFVPRGMAHGFVVLSDTAVFAYKVDNYYAPQAERGIRFDDPTIGIDWQVPANKLILSSKDKAAPVLKDIPLFLNAEA
ncbi:MAG: dTDP-4-dehydrorhamnose 3,5-epimerase [Prevotellaceae bacterium]|jgi:dTDP-4-dehydrorhamnose 3,5-epimerase|nr:dTDP-4-dehydrorhamnose 3,5-epimerase [Prevotellaceae bacterium]